MKGLRKEVPVCSKGDFKSLYRLHYTQVDNIKLLHSSDYDDVRYSIEIISPIIDFRLAPNKSLIRPLILPVVYMLT